MKVKIGLETHVQLSTKSKLFCSCQNPVWSEAEPNSFLCPTCLGMPGSKPRANRKAIEFAVKIALALNCHVLQESHFSRKTYFYPDMPKNYQITQYELPLAENGWLELEGKTIRIKRIHLEEDPARLQHVGGLKGKYTLVDYNRAGIPLVEIVTHPDFTTPEEARRFISKLEAILEYLGVYNPKSFAVIKSDANISLEGGERIEVKNITGAKEIEQALKFELVRQQNLLKRGLKPERETRAWNPDLQVTEPLREKELEEEYGYIFDPDLPAIKLEKGFIEKIRKSLPELPEAKLSRFIKQYGLNQKLAESLVSDRGLAELFEWLSKRIDPKLAASWAAGPLKKTLNWHKLTWEESGVRPEWILEVLKLYQQGKLTDLNAELTIRKLVEEKRPPREIIRDYEWEKEKIDLKPLLSQLIKEYPGAVQDYKKGKTQALDFLVGKAVAETRGKVDPKEIREILKKLL